MKKKLIDLLETFGFPVYLQGSLNEDAEYPETFITFWNFENPDDQFYDNGANGSVWGFWVFLYSSDPLTVETESDKIKKLLQANGFIFSDVEDADSGRETHTGRMLTLYYMEV